MSPETHLINWHSWSPETFEKAEREQKPILLAITATWCHWCHVMEYTTFGDDRVAEIINSRFIPVRADNDKRPDLNTRYNMGGWPTVAFLTPAGDILTGATYLPPRQMIDLLSRVDQVYAESREELLVRAAEMQHQKQEETTGEPTATALLTEHISQSILRAIEGAFDPVYGGFGVQQKFPHVPVIELLLTEYRRTGNDSYLEMATMTFDSMRSGGLYDPIEGGFFRYATTRDWSVPHYEKMLEDNAGLVSAYIQAYNATDNSGYLQTAVSVMKYMEKTLRSPDYGAFYGSQNADEDYYRLSADERHTHTPPSVDQTIYTHWNAIAAAAYLKAYASIGNRRYLTVGLEVLDFLIKHCSDGVGYYHYYDSEPKEQGLLLDQVNMGQALIAAYECTGNRDYLEKARAIAERMTTEYADPRGGFFDVTEERLKKENLHYREKLLDENSEAARFLNKLSYYTFESSFRFAAEAALRSMTGAYEQFGIMAAPYAMAVTEIVEEPVRVAIAGQLEDPRTEQLLSSSLRARQSSSLVHVLDEEMDADELQSFGIGAAGEPRAAVCVGETCKITSDPNEVADAIREAESKHRGVGL